MLQTGGGWQNPRCVLDSGAMPIDPKLLEILACPLCKTPVKLTSDGQGLTCSQCRRRYPIKDDIPIMLVDQAIIDDRP